MPSPLSFPGLRLLPGLLLALAPLAVADDAAPAAGDSSQQSAYRNSIAEESVRAQTEKIQAEIGQLMAELQLNGMTGADLAILSNASTHLKTLSQEDMQKVINALQSASITSKAQDRQQSLVSAYQGQKEVSLKLETLAAYLAAQESQKEIPSRLENLIARQSANIRETSTLQASGHTVGQLDPQQKSTHEVISSEQTSIGGEIDLLDKMLAATPAAAPPADAGTDPGNDMAKTVLDALKSDGLPDAAHAAIELTSSGPFPDAVAKQTTVRDDLTSLLRAALAGTDSVSRLQDVKTQLGQIVEDQKDLAAVTAQSQLDPFTLAEREAKISDRASVAEALLKPVSPAASNQVSAAELAMQQTSATLAKATNPATAASQEQAIADDLTKTEALLDAQVAAAQKEEALPPTDRLAQLQQLQSQIAQAQQNPAVSAADLQNLQQAATTPSPEAANKIADAADQLKQAQPDAAAANALLAQANAAVQQQEDGLKQAAQAYQALSQASQQLTQAQQQASEAAQAMQKNPNDLTQAARDLSQAQAAVGQAQQNPPQGGLPSAAQQALQQASDALKKATLQAVQAQSANAQAQNQQAMAAMQSAQTGLAQAMAQAQQQGQGQQPGQPQLGQQPGQPQPGQPGQPQPGQQQNSPSTQAMATEAPDRSSHVLGGIGVGGVAQVVGGLKPKDRAAIVQYQAEKAPPEYAPMVQQYLKNIADSSDSGDAR